MRGISCISIMNERLEITFQVALDLAHEMKLVSMKSTISDGLFHD